MWTKGENMENFEINTGDIVLSESGRDGGKFLVVIGRNGSFVEIADGDLRKMDNLKKKNIKHLKYMETSSFIKGKLENGERPTNAELRREIAEFSEKFFLNF